MVSRPKTRANDTVTNFFDSIDDVGKLIHWRNVLLDRLAAAKQ
jgi:hypothetical protein